MNTIFIITGDSPDIVKMVGQWFANRVAIVYSTVADVGNSIPELPVAILVDEDAPGLVSKLNKISKSRVVQVHAGSVERTVVDTDSYYFLACEKVNAKDVGVMMSLENIWKQERLVGKPVSERPHIHVPS